MLHGTHFENQGFKQHLLCCVTYFDIGQKCRWLRTWSVSVSVGSLLEPRVLLCERLDHLLQALPLLPLVLHYPCPLVAVQLRRVQKIFTYLQQNKNTLTCNKTPTHFYLTLFVSYFINISNQLSLLWIGQLVLVLTKIFVVLGEYLNML